MCTVGKGEMLHYLDRLHHRPCLHGYCNRVQRMNYESYTPVGILKKAWLDKHTQEVPSVLVVFYELDWEDPDWDAKKLECQSRVEVVRCSGLCLCMRAWVGGWVCVCIHVFMCVHTRAC